MAAPVQEMSFWDHLEELRGVLFKSVAVIFLFAILFFIFLPDLFDSVILAPCYPDFILYRGLCQISQYITANTSLDLLPDFCSDDFQVHLINFNLAAQFFKHMSTSFWLALVFSFPFVIYFLWSFVSPALYEKEKRNSRWAFLFGNLLFFLGVCVGYLLVFPLTLRFLASYQLSAAIPNQISLDSYLNNFLTLILVMGIVFELPLLCWILSSMGLVTKSFFRKYRKYAVVAILVGAAFITPSSDPFTLAVVFFPLYFLYELSAFIVKNDKPEQEDETALPEA